MANLKIEITRDKAMCKVFNTDVSNLEAVVRTIKHIAQYRLDKRDSDMLLMYIDYIALEEIGAKYHLTKQAVKKITDKLLNICKSYIEVFNAVRDNITISDIKLLEIKTLRDVGFTNAQIMKLNRADVITLEDLLKADLYKLYNTRSIGAGVIDKVHEVKMKYGVVD